MFKYCALILILLIQSSILYADSDPTWKTYMKLEDSLDQKYSFSKAYPRDTNLKCSFDVDNAQKYESSTFLDFKQKYSLAVKQKKHCEASKLIIGMEFSGLLGEDFINKKIGSMKLPYLHLYNLYLQNLLTDFDAELYLYSSSYFSSPESDFQKMRLLQIEFYFKKLNEDISYRDDLLKLIELYLRDYPLEEKESEIIKLILNSVVHKPSPPDQSLTENCVQFID